MSSRILVVDAQPWSRNLILDALRPDGHALFTAADGEEALAIADKEAPEVILTEVAMPRLDGWGFLRRFRQRKEHAIVPVFFVTSLNAPEDRLKGFRLGADDFIAKPFRADELRARVAAVLARRKAVEAHYQAQAPAEEQGAFALRGSLEHVSLSSILAFLEMEKLFGAIELDHPVFGKAQILVNAGHITHAEIERTGVQGEPAIFLLLDWTNGTFHFRKSESPVPGRMDCSTVRILMEWARRSDEQRSDPRGAAHG